MIMSLFFSLLIGYGFGSIPFGWLLVRIFGKTDLRLKGSGNTGATNVLRSGSKILALLTLFLDFFKGIAAILVVKSLFPFGTTLGPVIYILPNLLAAVGALLGHGFPVWLKFKGGKGVATAFGILAVFSWPMMLLVGLMWLVTALLSRYASLASLISWTLLPLYGGCLIKNPPIYFLSVFIAIFILIRHRDNIERLLAGKEFKIGDLRK